MAPKRFTKADSTGRPWWGLLITLSLGGALAYLNVSTSGTQVFEWFSNLTSLFTLFGWGMICFSHIRFRQAWKIQGRSPAELPWKSWTFPLAAWWGLIWCIIIVGIEFYLAVFPLHKPTTAKNFFANYISVFVIIVLFLGARFYYRGPWLIDTARLDLDYQRRFYATDEEKAKKPGALAKAGRACNFVFN